MVGATWAISLVSFIGVITMPIALVATIALSVPSTPRRGATGAIAGASVPLFYIAWMHREGPGEVCRDIRGGHECIDEISPVPWFVAGLVLFAAGLTITAVHARRRVREG